MNRLVSMAEDGGILIRKTGLMSIVRTDPFMATLTRSVPWIAPSKELTECEPVTVAAEARRAIAIYGGKAVSRNGMKR